MSRRAGWGVAAAAAASVIAFLAAHLLPFAVALLMAGVAGGASTATPSSVPGINPVLMAAYAKAVSATGTLAAGCTGMRWSILAGIAQVESGQAAGRHIADNGDVTPPILGPALSGGGAMGLLQFIPSSWAIFGVDLNGDGAASPNNAFDAAGAAVKHLCGSTPVNLADPAALSAALLGYNHSQTYVSEVTSWITRFEQLSAERTQPAQQVAPSERAAAILAAAMSWVGKAPYSWGGGSPSGPSTGICCSPGGQDGSRVVGFDCSGLSGYAAAQAGLHIPRTAAAQATVGTWISRSGGLAALQPGDLVFFAANPDNKASIHHVGVYAGGGQMVNAARPGTQVRVEPLWLDEYAGAVHL